MILKVLGTVSPHCHKDKNCPGYLVTTSTSTILLDCGNGITRNLNYPEDIQNLTIIISHLHRDHYSDLFSIAYDTYVYHNLGLLTNKVKVYIPKPTSKEELLDYQILTNLGEEQYLEIIPYQQQDIIQIGSSTITFSPNPHSIPSYSIKIKEQDKSIVYSGDTGYIGNTIEKFAAGSNLLICESTFLKGQTKKKDYHLYAHEAAQIAVSANVDKLLLTHFWPDIDKELYLQEAIPLFKKTLIAQENMVLNLK
jgi:ribonuclease BN (tRNA processing enzyme)